MRFYHLRFDLMLIYNELDWSHMAVSKLNSILVPLDGSKNAARGLSMAIGLAKQSQARIIGMCVLQRPPHHAFRSARLIQYPEKQMLKEAEKILNSAGIHCVQSEVLFEKKIVFGDPGQMIVKFAKDKKIDTVVIGARGRGAIKEVFFGSVSNYVVHKSNVPVLVVK